MGQYSPAQGGSPSHSGLADMPGPRISCHIQPAENHCEIRMGGSRYSQYSNKANSCVHDRHHTLTFDTTGKTNQIPATVCNVL